MSLEVEIAALRSAAGFSRLAHVAVLRFEGADAFDLLSVLSSRRLFLREAQVSHTLFLRDDGAPFADVYVGSGEDGAFYALAEGPSAPELIAHIQTIYAERTPGADFTVHDLSGDFELWGIDGPYAWEVVSALVGPVVLGMPYLTLLHWDDALCFRVGKTGEYGYNLLVPRSTAPELRDRLVSEGEPLGLRPVSLAALDRCALENWHFCIRTLRHTPLAQPLTPLELQLQWRVSRDHDHVGAPALRARRERGVEVRATCFTADSEISAGQPIRLDGQLAGEVLAATWSWTCQKWLGSALLALPLAHPGIDRLHIVAEEQQIAISTQTPPLINNRSLHVDPHRHSYRTRESDEFPPLALGVA